MRQLNQIIFEVYLRICGIAGFLVVSGGGFLSLLLFVPHWLGFQFPNALTQIVYGTICFCLPVMWLSYSVVTWWQNEMYEETGRQATFAEFRREFKTWLICVCRRAALIVAFVLLGTVCLWAMKWVWTYATTPDITPVQVKLTPGQSQNFPLTDQPTIFVVHLSGNTLLQLKTEAGVSIQISNAKGQMQALKKGTANDLALAITEPGEYRVTVTTTKKQSRLEMKLVKAK